MIVSAEAGVASQLRAHELEPLDSREFAWSAALGEPPGRGALQPREKIRNRRGPPRRRSRRPDVVDRHRAVYRNERPLILRESCVEGQRFSGGRTDRSQRPGPSNSLVPPRLVPARAGIVLPSTGIVAAAAREPNPVEPQRVMMSGPLLGDVAVQDGVETTRHDREPHVEVDDEAADRHERGDRVDQHRDEAQDAELRGNRGDNHSTMPDTSSATPPTTISQKSCFCPKLKRPAGGTCASSLRM